MKMTELLKRKEITLAIVWITVLIVFADYFIGGEALNNTFKSLTVDWVVIIANIAIIVGGLAVFQRSVILAQGSNLELSERAMYAWQVIVAAGLFLLGTTLGIESSLYNWIYNYILVPSWRTVYTIIIFFMATASYRAFRARTTPAAVMLICALLVLLRNAPIGEAIWSGFYDLGTWVLDVVNLSASRAIMIGAMIGATSLLIRILLGKEKILGEEE
jgi:hypothetical protein